MLFQSERPQPVFYMAGQLKGFEPAKSWGDGTLVLIANIEGLGDAPDLNQRIAIKPEWCSPSFNDAGMEFRDEILYRQNIGSPGSPGLLVGFAGSTENAAAFFEAIHEVKDLTSANLAYALNQVLDSLEKKPVLFTTKQSVKRDRNPTYDSSVEGSQQYITSLTRYREVGYIQYLPTTGDDFEKAVKRFLTAASKASEKYEKEVKEDPRKKGTLHDVELKFNPDVLASQVVSE